MGRERKRALIRKQAGRGVKSMGRTGVVRYSQTKRHDPHEAAAIQFAKNVAKFLKKERQQKHFDTLTVVAEPHFLGKLKLAMSLELKKTVHEWIRKDLQKTPQSQLIKFLMPTKAKKNESIPLDW